MKDPVVIIGIGEIGSVFARGFLRTGHPVYPVTREMDLQAEAMSVPEPCLVLVAVGEKDLQDTLAKLPEPWRTNVALIQNELLPADWKQHDLLAPTVASIWFEKKKGQDVKVVVASPIHGPHAGLMANALDALDIPNEVITDEDQLLFELVRKNFYILTSNIAGLKTGGTVSELWKQHQTIAQSVVDDVHIIQEYLTEQELDKKALTKAMLVAFEGDPEHKCMGRSAPARLQRALTIAKQGQLSVPGLSAIADNL
jgi:ketopantoate reductase